MCFNPTVSLTTAVIEWTLALLMPFKYPKSTMRYMMSAVMFFLGLYQFTEFMLCKTTQTDLWMRVGFVAYSLLPAIGLHGAMKFLKIKRNLFWIYIIPVIFIIFASTTKQFVSNGQCHDIFVTAQNTLFTFTTPIKTIGFSIYITYYFGFILATCLMFIRKFLKERNIKKQKILLAFPLAVFLMSFPTYLLIILFPALNIRFPSVLCHFALLLALTAYVGVRWEHELNSK